MFTILTRNPFKKLHRAAFSGPAVCPSCFGGKVRLLERIGPYTYRWQCKACYQVFREDLTPQGHFGDDPKTREVGNPYASFKGIEGKVREALHSRSLLKDMHIGIHKFKK